MEGARARERTQMSPLGGLVVFVRVAYLLWLLRKHPPLLPLRKGGKGSGEQPFFPPLAKGGLGGWPGHA